MRILWSIVGMILLLPILLTLVALAVVTLIGGYIWVVLQVAWWVVAAIVAVILAIRLIKKFT